MKRHIAWLLSCGLLVGCGATPPPIDEPPAPTPAPNQSDSDPAPSSSSPSDAAHAPAAFHFKSGVLEIGDFDPYTLGDNIFDPCTEISPEEFAAAGFDNVEPLPEEYAGLAKGLSACEIRDSRGVPIADISNNTANRGTIADNADVFPNYTSSLLPTLFTYDFGDPNSTSCYAQVDTTRGGLSVGVPGLPGRDARNSTCERAIQVLEELFALP
ncbi:DUF3558 family protein [uncultured Corynebacterium sp.]|uniref:DUF3558 family protein n=1 Tax=uncultured Corynebacterium sp. TaxID=159447 RepID=UPI00259BADD2|nr:DUF3558 family protein [uncultured Corynebacterium sp.]